MSDLMKPDAKQFVYFIDQLQKNSWLGISQKWWPKFLFHFTDINNAVKILESGKLLSRLRLEQTKEMVVDNASPDVISHTDDIWKNYVRLYFRPRTPTQHQNEGFRPKKYRGLGAHCPVPVYFLFDSKKLLTRKNVLFSKKSLAIRGTEVFSSFTDFSEVPFQAVYHDSSFSQDERGFIVQHRHAEVIVPGELDLEDLRYIWCRSEAEYQTLLGMLSTKAKNKWSSKIGSGKKGNFFFRKWFFIENVSLSESEIIFNFNSPVSLGSDTLHLELEIKESSTGKKYIWKDEAFKLKHESISFSLSNLKDPSNYEVSLLSENRLLYSDVFVSEEGLPF